MNAFTSVFFKDNKLEISSLIDITSIIIYVCFLVDNFIYKYKYTFYVSVIYKYRYMI